MKTDSRSWQPNWGVPPGEILLEALQDRGMTQSELARRTDRPIKTINEIIKGKAAITPETAIQFERVLQIGAGLWNGLESKYREFLARQNAELELERDAPWVDTFPIVDLIRYKLVERGATKANTLAALLSYFRVSSPSAWERQWLEPSASFRASAAFMSSPKAIAAWLRWGEIEADKIECSPFNAEAFRDALREIRGLTAREPFSMVVERVRRLCAGAGVAVVLTPEFEGTHLSGVARWISPQKALIQMSLRHKSDDHFWFTFFHEAGHVLQAMRRHDFIDSAEPEEVDPNHLEEEEAANQFARDFLINFDAYIGFCLRGNMGAIAVREFAKQQGVSPGIIVGRLQRDKKLDQSQLNSLKKKLVWGKDIRA
jgi:HTH-type transcriptional regulator/antitoxin HigA